MSNDYIPTRDADFDPWFENLKNYVAAKTGGASPLWTHIPGEKVTALIAGYTDWHGAYEKTLAPHTGVDTEAKNAAKKRAVGFIRPFVKQYLRFLPVSNEDRKAMNIPNASESQSPVAVPKTSPRLSIDTGTRRRLIIYYKDEKSGRRGKPKGVHGMELRWAILEHPPVDTVELTRSSFDTNPPLTLEFEEHERGKRVYMCGAWQIDREGEQGPSGEIVEAIIP
ncbi:MAG: hypothetical protein LBU25_05515 [Treponema sp.]|jgi:hypothetical protein|nr:hypothetical protein [Treponema sp.]